MLQFHIGTWLPILPQPSSCAHLFSETTLNHLYAKFLASNESQHQSNQYLRINAIRIFFHTPEHRHLTNNGFLYFFLVSSVIRCFFFKVVHKQLQLVSLFGISNTCPILRIWWQYKALCLETPCLVSGEKFLICWTEGWVWFCVLKHKYLLNCSHFTWLTDQLMSSILGAYCTWGERTMSPPHLIGATLCCACFISFVGLAVAITAAPGVELHGWGQTIPDLPSEKVKG